MKEGNYELGLTLRLQYGQTKTSETIMILIFSEEKDSIVALSSVHGGIILKKEDIKY